MTNTDYNRMLAIHNADTSLVLDLSEAALPAVLHWGANLGELTETELAALALTDVEPNLESRPDHPVRISMLPEQSSGWDGRPGLIGSRLGQAWSPKFSVTSVTVNGESLSGTRNFTGPTQVCVQAQDPQSELALTIEIETLPGGAFRSRAAVKNLANAPYQVDSLTLALPVPRYAQELLDYAGRWSQERTPHRRAWEPGMHLRESRRGRTGADSAYVLHAGTPGFNYQQGEIWAVHTAWSGNHIHYAEQFSSGGQVLGGGELLLPGEIVLGQGETYASPWIYASWGNGMDAVAHRFHDYLRSRPQHPTSKRPVTMNVWEAVYFNHDLDVLTELAQAAAKIGVERYVLDDGWFGARRNERAGLGDWTVAPEVWPSGLGPLADVVTGLGMEFGLWFEPEMVNPDSEIARQHPEWVMAADPQRWPVESRFQQVLNLGIEECYQQILEAMSSLLAQYPISYVKWDHNRDLIEAGNQLTGRPGVHAQTLAFYRLLDTLRERFPDVEFESCSSGGARIDLEVMQRAERVWGSDCIDPLERQQIERGLTSLIPPEMIGSHIASDKSHTTGRRHNLDFRAGTAIFGHLGIEWDLRQASEQNLTELSQWVEFYKTHRELLHSGTSLRLDHPDPAVIARGVVAKDLSEALYSVAFLRIPRLASGGKLRLPGLNPQGHYRVVPVLPTGELAERFTNYKPAAWMRGENGTVTGEESPVLSGRVLAEVGLAQPSRDAEQVLLFHVQRVD